MYPGRVNVFMGQPPSGDDKPELKFPEALPHKWHGRATWLLSFKRTSILSATVAAQRSIAKKN